ncbi:MAG TPA: alpha/beta hydrolase [Longimicrobium sp.]|jgi:hypothetical protein
MPPHVLLVPGLFDSSPGHWQSLWHAAHPEYHRVVQRDWVNADRADWVGTLNRSIEAIDGPVVLVAHSLACITVAHWARSAGSGRVVGALLVAPSDVDLPTFPAGTTGFAPVPLEPLPFPSVLVASSDDEYITAQRARELGAAWGSRMVEVGAAGHINTSAGFGPWPAGEALLEELRRG